MTVRESSDELSTLASRMLNRDMLDESRTAIGAAVVKARNADELIAELRVVLKPFLDDVASLAGSVLSQASK